MEKYHIPPLVKKILTSRGYKTKKDMIKFLFSGISSLSEPFSIPSLRKACEVLKEAILDGKKIFLYGDGDADGICAVYLLVKLLKNFSADFDFRLTHRLDEDYEIEDKLVGDIAKDGYSLLISADCGISSFSALEKAEQLGIQSIVLDHHIGEVERLPKSHIYVNPFIGDKWPEGTENLSGAGIVFKFVEGMGLILPGMKERYFRDFIEIIAISVLADFLPLTGENRIFVKEGLRKLPFTKIAGLASLIEGQSITPPLSQRDVVMKINPKLNSPGRMGKPEIALNLLLEEDPSKIRDLRDEIERIDRKRYRDLVKEMRLLSGISGVKSGFIISKRISPGICGVIASRLTGKYKRPYLVGCELGDTLKGSIRAPKGYNLYKELKPLAEYMDSLGGHAGAMGFKCHVEYAGKLKRFWEKIEWIPDEPPVYYDVILDIDKLLPDTIKEVNSLLRPYGRENLEPIYFCKDVLVRTTLRNRKDVKSFWVKKRETIYESFLMDLTREIPSNGEKIDIFYTPSVSGNNGLYRIYLKIHKYRYS